MGAMVQKQENLGELEQVVERCLDKRLGEFKSVDSERGFSPTQGLRPRKGAQTPARAHARGL